MDDIVPFNPDQLVRYDDGFLIPKHHVHKGVAVHISGASLAVEPVALVLVRQAVTDNWFITLCNVNGPVWSLPVSSIVDVKPTEFRGISFPVNTPQGIKDMVPPNPSGIEIGYVLTPEMQGRLRLHTLTSRAAERWISAIQLAKVETFKNQDRRGFE